MEMSDQDRANIERHRRFAHAMQAGVAIEEGRGSENVVRAKHLRVGINVALRDHASLVGLLIKKGVITNSEYLQAIADGMEQEAREYEERLSKELGGAKITLV